MRALSFSLLALTLAACGTETDSAAGDQLEPMLTGNIAVTGQDAQGTVEIFHAFGFDQGGKVMIYASSNPDFDCDMAVTLLSDRDRDFDPTGYYAGGTCDIFIKFDQGYEGQISGTDDPFLRSGFAINCFTGDGEFAWEDRTDGGDDGYYWSGRKYQAYPTVYSFDVSGGDEGDYSIVLDFIEYEGSFPDEGDFNKYPASGAVKGSMTATWCPALGTADRFSE